jgi:hypothetical protein
MCFIISARQVPYLSCECGHEVLTVVWFWTKNHEHSQHKVDHRLWLKDIYNRLLSSTRSNDCSSVFPIAHARLAWLCPLSVILWSLGVVDRCVILPWPPSRRDHPVRSPTSPIWPKPNRHLSRSRLMLLPPLFPPPPWPALPLLVANHGPARRCGCGSAHGQQPHDAALLVVLSHDWRHHGCMALACLEPAVSTAAFLCWVHVTP